MLRLLHSAGDGDLATEFLRRVVMAKYDGSESEALAAVMPLVGPEAAGSFRPGFVESHLPRRPKCIVTFLALAGGTPKVTASRVWRSVLREGVRKALSCLGTALEAASRADADQSDHWPPGLRTFYVDPADKPPPDARMDHEATRDLFVLAWRLGLAEESASAARTIGDHPKVVTPDRMLPAALADMHGHPALARTAAYGLLWRQASDFLLARSSALPIQPSDWTIAAEVPCACDLCAKLRAFCQDPVARVERFKVRKDLRKHLHQTIDGHRLDLYHETERQGSPYTLACTKNRASYLRRLKEYAEDLLCMDSLLVSAPERERQKTRAGSVARLERALAIGRTPAKPVPGPSRPSGRHGWASRQRRALVSSCTVMCWMSNSS